MRYVIYTDGGSRGNPGEGAWGYVQIIKDIELVSHAEYSENTTNNEMELTAVLKALQYCQRLVSNQKDCLISIHSDSTYCVNGISSWMYNWNHQGTLIDRPNGMLWSRIYELVNSLKSLGVKVEMVKVKGHSGDKWNERVDEIVNESMDLKCTVHNESSGITTTRISDLEIKEVRKIINIVDWSNETPDSITVVAETDNWSKVELRIKKNLIKNILKSL